MAKKKRCKKIVVYIAREGDREEHLLNYLQEIFDPEKNIQLKYSQEKGGNSNAILDRALKNAYYPKVYAWLKLPNIKFYDGLESNQYDYYILEERVKGRNLYFGFFEDFTVFLVVVKNLNREDLNTVV